MSSAVILSFDLLIFCISIFFTAFFLSIDTIMSVVINCVTCQFYHVTFFKKSVLSSDLIGNLVESFLCLYVLLKILLVARSYNQVFDKFVSFCQVIFNLIFSQLRDAICFLLMTKLILKSRIKKNIYLTRLSALFFLGDC